MRRKIIKTNSNAKLKIIILITVGILFALSPIIMNNHSFTQDNSDYNGIDNENLKLSKISGKIHIIGNSGWVNAETAEICTGNGTQFEPYVIEDLEIDGGGSGSCILIENSDVYFEIENCTLYNSGGASSSAGISLSNVTNGQLINNTLSLNQGDGIYLNDCFNSEVLENKVSNNTGYGIAVENCENIIIGENNFSSNGMNALDNGTTNMWDDGAIGNYWDDYGGIDANDDGIGDTPYEIPGSAGSQDNYPIWEDGDDLSPNIIINSPSMNDAYGINAPTFDITLNDASSINSSWYTIDGGITNYTFSGLTGTVNQTAWDNKTTELMTLRFYANDSLGYIDFKDVMIWKDLIAPKITINSPTPNQWCGIAAPSFNLTIDEPNLQIKRYSLNGRPNITFTTETQFSIFEWGNIGNGTVIITFYAIDKVGNVDSSQVVVRKDSVAPEITINSPSENAIYEEETPPYFSFRVIEDNPSSVYYTLSWLPSAYQYPISFSCIPEYHCFVYGQISETQWEFAREGEVTITFYAEDEAGNIGSKSVTIIKELPPLTWYDPNTWTLDNLIDFLVLLLTIGLPMLAVFGIIYLIIYLKDN